MVVQTKKHTPIYVGHGHVEGGHDGATHGDGEAPAVRHPSREARNAGDVQHGEP